MTKEEKEKCLMLKKLTAIKVGLASPEQIRGWSHGEVLKPETIN